jgi:tetratricopeptide (TPR) repeat protein
LNALSASTLSDAEDAYERGDYATARRLFFEVIAGAPDERTATLSRYREAQCALELRQFDSALDAFGRLVSSSDTGIASRARFMTGLVHYRRGDYDEARRVWADVVRTVEDSNIAAQAQFAAGWCAVRFGDVATATDDFGRVVLLFSGSDSARRAGEMLERLRGAAPLERRSEGKAALLSTFLPGSGQVYAGRVGNGCLSFVLNGLAAYALTRSLATRRWWDATFVFALGSRFYFGGRRNAARFAADWNTRQRAALVERLSDLEP